MRSITVDPATPTTLYAAVGGVYRSVDSGVTWTSVNGNLPSTVTAGDGTVSAIVIDSSSPGVNPTWGNLYAAADGAGVYASSDGGVTWTLIPGLPGADDSVLTLALDPLPPATLYAGTSTGKVFRWQIGGLGGWTSFKRRHLLSGPGHHLPRGQARGAEPDLRRDSPAWAFMSSPRIATRPGKR